DCRRAVRCASGQAASLQVHRDDGQDRALAAAAQAEAHLGQGRQTRAKLEAQQARRAPWSAGAGMTIVGIISDTHGLLRPEALLALKGSDHILHAGDIGPPDILERLREIAPVTAVRGNVDTGAWAERLPPTANLSVAGRVLYMI